MSDVRWLVEDFAAAVERFDEALAERADADLIKAGCIQYFEFCFELAWKSCKVLLAEQGLHDCASPKSCLREAFAQGWIDREDIWLDMLDARNLMSHTYDASRALQVYESLPGFLHAFRELRQALQREIGA